MAGATQVSCKRSVLFARDFHLFLLLMKMLHSAVSVSAQESVTWYQLEPQLLEPNGSLVSSEVVPRQSDLFACVWTRISYFRRPSVALSVGSREASIGDVSVGLVPKGVLLKQGRSVWVANANVTPLTWYYLCLSVTPSMVSLLLDGSRLLHEQAVTDYLTGNILILLGGSLKWPDVPPSTFTLTSTSEESWSDLTSKGEASRIVGSFAGDLVDPKVWGDILQDSDIKKLMVCKAIDKRTLRDLSTWRTAGSSITSNSVDSTMPCQKKRFDYLLFPEPMKYPQNVELCTRMDLDTIFATGKDRQSLKQDALQYKETCGDGERTVWLSTDDGSCFALKNLEREVAPCSTLLCAGCQLKAGYRRLFILRGLCPLPDLDLAFVAVNNFQSRPYFKGTERYLIQKKANTWQLSDITNSIVLATTTAEDPVGTHKWKLAVGTCSNTQEVEVEASLSACRASESACRSGACIPMTNRCDGYPHCTDGSDEEACQPVRTPTDYLISAPPPKPPVDITVRIEVTRVVSTEPLLLLLNTHLSWEDSRLSFSNLRRGTDYPLPLNAVMWRPRLMVLAHRSSAPVDMVLQATSQGPDEGGRKSSASLTARTLAMPKDDVRDTATIDTIYPGTNTTLTLSEYVLRPIDCYYDLSFYPFDVHTCELALVLVPHGVEHAKLVIATNGARYTGRTRLNDFCFDEIKIRKENTKVGGRDHSGVVLSVRMSRRSSYIIVSVILPSLLLLCISTASLWMVPHPTKSSTRLLVNACVTGGFLGLWLIATFNSPVTGKVKALDVWLCFCTMHSILHALLHVFLDIFGTEDEPQPLFSSRVMSRAPSRMREVKPVESGSIYDNLMRVPENEETWTVAYWITFIARVVSPALVVLFNASFWPFVVYFSKNPLP